MLLSVNAGSSSLKMLLYDENAKNEKEAIVLKAKWEKEFSRLNIKIGNKSEILENPHEIDTSQAFEGILTYLCKIGYLRSPDEITKVGYRYVHGGTVFTKPTEVNQEDVEKLKEIDSLAITHNPVCRKTVEMGVKMLPNAKHILCFDTAFHACMPKLASMYGIDPKYYEAGIRKYGFHGLSYEYVSKEAMRILYPKSIRGFSGIICHLGNGSSITAIQDGKCIDTTMGFSTVDGLVMGERSGSIDPFVVKQIMEFENVDIDGVQEILSKQSGFKAISGISPDYMVLRDTVKNKESGWERAKEALDLLTYQIRKYIGSYMAILDHVDAVVFTGGIGENDTDFVEQCISTPGMKRFGLSLVLGNCYLGDSSNIPVLQVPTNEEIAIINTLKQS